MFELEHSPQLPALAEARSEAAHVTRRRKRMAREEGERAMAGK